MTNQRDPPLHITSIGGVAPLQITGYLGEDRRRRAFYFREREGWDVWIAPVGVTIEALWTDGEKVEGAYYAGAERWEEPQCDSAEEALAIIREHARQVFTSDGAQDQGGHSSLFDELFANTDVCRLARLA
jgi:hypothetical protein